MAFKLVNGLLPIIIKKEDEFGVPVLDFSDHDGVINGLPVNQSVDNPVNVTDTYNKEVIKSTFGSQIQKEGVQRLGQRTVSTSIGHDLGLNDFVVIGNMFFQNDYNYDAVLEDSSIVSVVSTSTTTTIEVASTENLTEGNIITISGRTSEDENDSFKVSNITTTTFDISYKNFDLTVEGLVSCALGIHESLIEDVNDCAAQELTNSYSVFIPEKFADNDGDCGTSQGNIINGVVPTVLNVDFVESNYSADFIAKSYEDYGDKSPRVEADYNLPTADGFMRQNFASLQYWDGTDFVNLETMGLDITITLGTEDSQKVRKAGELSRAIVDGVEITGNYSALYLTEDDLNNKSNSLYANRTSLENGGLFRIAVENTSGESIYIEGNIKFYNETLKPELGGFLFSTEFQFLRSVANPNVKLTCINNYKQHLSTLL